MKYCTRLFVTAALGTLSLVSAAASASADTGSKGPHERPGDRPIEMAGTLWPEDGRVRVSVPAGAEVTRAYVPSVDGNVPITLAFNQDATEKHLLRPVRGLPDATTASIILEVTDPAAGQFRDGRIVFSAANAKVHGTRAKLESHPGNSRIGFWTNPDDYLTWTYKATRPGRYEALLTYSCAEQDGTKIGVEIGKEKLEGTLKSTANGWWGYTWISLGTVSIPAAGPIEVAVRCREKVGGAVMNFKALTLIPTGEGEQVVQAADGSVTLHARDVIIHGVQVQYEPKPQKNTVGFWTHASDTVSWLFTVSKPGKFDVEILQGCGKGQGGSTAKIELAGQELPLTVQDTGHFQNFVPRVIGTVTLDHQGSYQLKVIPTHKAGVAIMDLRQVRLLPK